MCEKQGRLRILVVDDEQKQRQILKILLNSEGYEVRTADSVETALERMAEKEPDIVITDLRMEGQDGIALLEQTKRKYPNCKVILLTGYGSIENAVEAMKKVLGFILSKEKVQKNCWQNCANFRMHICLSKMESGCRKKIEIICWIQKMKSCGKFFVL